LYTRLLRDLCTYAISVYIASKCRYVHMISLYILRWDESLSHLKGLQGKRQWQTQVETRTLQEDRRFRAVVPCVRHVRRRTMSCEAEGRQEIPYYRRKSFIIEANPLLYEETPYYKRGSLQDRKGVVVRLGSMSNPAESIFVPARSGFPDSAAQVVSPPATGGNKFCGVLFSWLWHHFQNGPGRRPRNIALQSRA